MSDPATVNITNSSQSINQIAQLKHVWSKMLINNAFRSPSDFRLHQHMKVSPENTGIINKHSIIKVENDATVLQRQRHYHHTKK